MIDARTHYDPPKAPSLIAEATAKAGSQKALAARLGVTPRYLQMLNRGEYKMTYPLQVALEAIAAEAENTP